METKWENIRNRSSVMRTNCIKPERNLRLLYDMISDRGLAGVCMMSNTWKEEQHPSFINFISPFLSANCFRLNFVPIAPDFIFNCGGLSVAFMFITNWDCNDPSPIFTRVQKLKGQFANLYVVVTLPTKEQNDSFVRSYFKYGMELGRPIFVPVQNLEMGFEQIVRIAHGRGVCKRQDAVSKLKTEWYLFQILFSKQN
ncbi:hypothetical protein U1Q18_016596 [Sarracenia purpurea var. burkii]